MMVCMDWRALSNLATLNTLKVLSILIVLKADKLAEPCDNAWKTISKIESQTTPPSRIFIVSEKYLPIPTAYHLMNIFIDENPSEPYIS